MSVSGSDVFDRYLKCFGVILSVLKRLEYPLNRQREFMWNRCWLCIGQMRVSVGQVVGASV